MTPEISDWLQRDERVLWSGRPAQGLVFTSKDWLAIPFSLVWGAGASTAALGSMSSARGSGLPNPFDLVSYLFLVVSLFVTVGRFAIDAWLRSITLYAVTDRRILIMKGWPLNKVMGMPIEEFSTFELTSKRGEPGTLKLSSPVQGWGSWGSWMPSTDPTPQFIGIANPAGVLDIIHDASRMARVGHH